MFQRSICVTENTEVSDSHKSKGSVHQDCLTVGTVAVAAGIIVKFHVSTVRTLGDVVAKATGFTIQDSMCCFFLYA